MLAIYRHARLDLKILRYSSTLNSYTVIIIWFNVKFLNCNYKSKFSRVELRTKLSQAKYKVKQRADCLQLCSSPPFVFLEDYIVLLKDYIVLLRKSINKKEY